MLRKLRDINMSLRGVLLLGGFLFVLIGFLTDGDRGRSSEDGYQSEVFDDIW